MTKIVAAITDVRSARSALAYFRRRSILCKITRDGYTKLSMFVPKDWTPEYALEVLRLKMPATARCFIEPDRRITVDQMFNDYERAIVALAKGE